VVPVLSEDEVAAFIQDGFIAIREAVPQDVVRACQDTVWSELEKQGVRRGDPATWTGPVVRIACPEGGPFAAAGTQPVLWEAFDQLIGEGRWWHREGVGGTIPVRFPRAAKPSAANPSAANPSAANPGAEDPGDAGWHIEGSYEKNGELAVNIRSRLRGLLALYLFTDVDEASAPTRIRPGSHFDAARVVAPAGDDGMRWTQAAQSAAKATEHLPTVLATGEAGDVFLCHPFLVHAASWPHTGAAPKIMAQPGVHLLDQFPLTDPLSPVEQAIAAATARLPAPGAPAAQARRVVSRAGPRRRGPLARR
jgi:hypothetical protein